MSTEVQRKLFGYRNLIAWQKSDRLAHLVYEATQYFPKDELFGLTSQLRRAVLSVPTNIVEGYTRNNKKEFCRFLLISLGSLAEVEYLAEFAYKQKYLNQDQYKEISLLQEEVGHIMWKLYISQK